MLEKLEQIAAERFLPDYAIVGADYVARLFNCSERAVVDGRFGTERIPRCRKSPVGFRKSDVHKVLRETSRSVREKAVEEMRKPKLVKRRKRSVITKK